MRAGLAIVALFGALAMVQAQNLLKGRCPLIRPIKRFNIKKFAGLWYERERTRTTFSNSQICSVAEYLLGIPGVVRFVSRGYDRYNDQPMVVNVNAIPNKKAPSQLGLLFDPRYGRTGYNILATDYKSYALTFACRERYGEYGQLYNEQALYLKTRSRGALPMKTRNRLFALARSYGISLQNMEVVVQAGCPAEH